MRRCVVHTGPRHRRTFPYHLGCLGPAKLKCNDTVSSKHDGGANWCGPGCGAEICVQPGTDKDLLTAYIDSFTAGWLDGYTTNEY